MSQLSASVKLLSRTMRLLVMPKLSPTMTKGKINKLFLKELQSVTSHDVVFEVATDTLLNTSNDQSIMDIEVIEDMYVARVFESSGAVLPVGRPIALLCDSLDDVNAARDVQIPDDYSVYDAPSDSGLAHTHIPMAMWQAYAQVEVEGCK